MATGDNFVSSLDIWPDFDAGDTADTDGFLAAMGNGMFPEFTDYLMSDMSIFKQVNAGDLAPNDGGLDGQNQDLEELTRQFINLPEQEGDTDMEISPEVAFEAFFGGMSPSPAVPMTPIAGPSIGNDTVNVVDGDDTRDGAGRLSPLAGSPQPMEPQRKPRKRRKQIVPAEVSYTDVAANLQQPRGPVPAPPPFQPPAVEAPAVPQQPAVPSFPVPYGPGPMPTVPTVCGNIPGGYLLFVPANNTPMPQPPTPSVGTGMGFFAGQNPAPFSQGPAFPQTAAGPATTTSTAPQSNKRPFTFVDATVPENFMANPNNHGRWEVDASGRRRYLNAPRNKRPRTDKS